jgi:AcrR family transcriptional regulator
MSSSRADTRTRLLEAARRLLEQGGPHGVGMEEIAQAANVSRQSVYLHFGSKTGLLLALVAHVDAQRDVNALVDRLWTLPDALSALDGVADLAARTNPEVHRIGLALDAARRWDAAFQPAWQDRTTHRLGRYRRLARWLRRDGALGAGWGIEQATSFLWSLTSVGTYDGLVVERGLSIEHYASLLRTSLRAALTSELRDAARSLGRPADPPTASGASTPDMAAD